MKFFEWLTEKQNGDERWEKLYFIGVVVFSVGYLIWAYFG